MSLRDFLHLDDMAAPWVYIIDPPAEFYRRHARPRLPYIDIGLSVECTIRALVEVVSCIVGFKRHVEFDASKLDGVPRKLTDVSRLAKIRVASISLQKDMWQTYTCSCRIGIAFTYNIDSAPSDNRNLSSSCRTLKRGW